MSARRSNLAVPMARRRQRRGWYDAVARHRFAPWLAAGVALVVQVVPTLVSGPPAPQFHDEFSYLLAADTFARGRLTNPTPAGGEHLETFQVIFHPTYQSKYPPGQGLILALGRVLANEPIVGVWVAVALASAAVVWMLRAWLPPRWALAGGLLAALHPLMLEWGQGFWGGALAALGGALLLGAFARLRRRTRAMTLLAYAAGMVVLGVSRPYEGLVIVMVVTGALVVIRARRRRARGLAGVTGGSAGAPPSRGARGAGWAEVTLQFGPAAGLLVAAAGMWMYYNYRVTGNPLLMPYIVHERQYAAAPSFLWQSPPAPKTYRHAVMRQVQVDYELAYYLKQRQSARGLASEAARKLGSFVTNYVAPPTLALAAVPVAWLVWRRRRVRLAVGLLGLFLAGELLAVWMLPHYVAPAFALVVLLLTAGLRSLWRWRWRVGRYRVGAVLVGAVVAGHLVGAGTGTIIRLGGYRESWGIGAREQTSVQIRNRAPRSLVFVRYGPQHNLHFEWVYNEADVEGAAVVWARDMGEAANRTLIDAYPGRAVWLLYDNGMQETDLYGYEVRPAQFRSAPAP